VPISYERRVTSAFVTNSTRCFAEPARERRLGARSIAREDVVQQALGFANATHPAEGVRE
jgi:hypothetical protein